MNSSIVSLSSKIKLLFHIVDLQHGPKAPNNHFHTLMKLRNAFAHSDRESIHADYTGYAEPDENGDTGRIDDIYYTVESITSDGTFNRLKRSEAFAKFLTSYDEVLKYLSIIRGQPWCERPEPAITVSERASER